MKICITGICGFVGFHLASYLRESVEGIEIWGVDNLSRAGSEINRHALQKIGIRLVHGDIRMQSDLESLPKVDWLVDAAANPSVLGGVDGAQSSRQVVEHNLQGTIQMLEFCKRHCAGFLLLSTSRVYSIAELSCVPLREENAAFVLDKGKALPVGVSAAGIDEQFSTVPPLSIYGMTKRCSELLALEYAEAFDFPVWINRCGVLAGAGQFGRADQGIFSFWVHSWSARRPLKYIGFGGKGHQVRDCLHPLDLARLVAKQIAKPEHDTPRIVNVAGGSQRAMSLAQLSAWCAQRFSVNPVSSEDSQRKYDLPWVVLDSQKAADVWQWKPEVSLESILEEIAGHAEANPDWLQRTASQSQS